MTNAATVSALLLLALAGGFLFAYFWKLTRFPALRLEGQQLIFVAVGIAVPLLILARLFLLAAPLIFSEYIIDGVTGAWRTLVDPLGTPSALPTFFTAFVLGPILGLLFEVLTPKRWASNYVMDRYGSDLERFLYFSVRGRLFVSVTLDNRKVYIGWTGLAPFSGPSDKDGAKDFTLLPVLSGYRNEETLKLEITTDYTSAYQQIERSDSQVSIDDFEIVIPVSRVVTANPFSLDVDQKTFAMPPTTDGELANPPTERTDAS